MKRRTEGHPILPIEVFWDLYDAFGDEISTEILDRVQERRISVEEAKGYLRYAGGERKGNVCLFFVDGSCRLRYNTIRSREY